MSIFWLFVIIPVCITIGILTLAFIQTLLGYNDDAEVEDAYRRGWHDSSTAQQLRDEAEYISDLLNK